MAIGIFVSLLIYSIPPINNDYLNILLRISIITVVYLFLIYRYKVSNEFEVIANDFMGKILKKRHED